MTDLTKKNIAAVVWVSAFFLFVFFIASFKHC